MKIQDVAGILLEDLLRIEPAARRRAVECLARLDDGRVFPALCSVLRGDPSPMVRMRVAESLRGARAVPVLREALHDPDDFVRYAAVVSLGRASEPSTVRDLCRTAADGTELVRREVCHALGRLGSREAVPVLCATLLDRSLRVCQASAEALQRVGDRRAIDPRACSALFSYGIGSCSGSARGGYDGSDRR